VKKKREISLVPVLSLPQRMKFSTVTFKKAIPGKKEATHHETDIQPLESPEIILHILEAM
jgi:hypothetical protein